MEKTPTGGGRKLPTISSPHHQRFDEEQGYYYNDSSDSDTQGKIKKSKKKHHIESDHHHIKTKENISEKIRSTSSVSSRDSVSSSKNSSFTNRINVIEPPGLESSPSNNNNDASSEIKRTKQKVLAMLSNVQTKRSELEVIQDEQDRIRKKIQQLKTEVAVWIKQSEKSAIKCNDHYFRTYKYVPLPRIEAKDVLQMVERFYGEDALMRVADELDRLHKAKYDGQFDIRFLTNPDPQESTTTSHNNNQSLERDNRKRKKHNESSFNDIGGISISRRRKRRQEEGVQQSNKSKLVFVIYILCVSYCMYG